MNEADFIRAIDEDPEDLTTQLVYADWLEEKGDPRAEAWRVLLEMDFRPTQTGDERDPESRLGYYPRAGLWYWNWPRLPELPQISSSESCAGLRRSYFFSMNDAVIAWVRGFRDPHYARGETGA